MTRKKTLYDVLGITDRATSVEVQHAYIKCVQYLQSNAHQLSAEDVTNQLKFAKEAQQTLANPATRKTYDASLIAPVEVPMPVRAAQTKSTLEWPSMRAILTVIAGLLAFGLFSQIGFTMYAYQRNKQLMGDPDSGISGRSRAEEKVILQEYRQEHGIEAADTIEASLLENQRRKEEALLRETRRAQDEKAREYERFREESHRIGNEVSANLRRAEEQAQRQAEMEKRKEEYEARQKQAQEDTRIRREKAQWAAELRK